MARKKPMKKILVVLLILLLFVGCATKIETKPSLDLDSDLEEIRKLMPDNRQFEIKEVHNVDDILQNSAQYLRAWQLWESFALSLNAFVTSLSSQLRP